MSKLSILGNLTMALILILFAESVYSEKLEFETSMLGSGLRVIDYSAIQPMDIQYLAYEKFGN